MPSEKPCPFVNERRKIMLLILLLLLLLFAKACVQNIHVLFNNETKKKLFFTCVGSRNQKLQNRTLVG